MQIYLVFILATPHIYISGYVQRINEYIYIQKFCKYLGGSDIWYTRILEFHQ